MEAEEQQDATVRAGGQTDGWENATENWRRIQNAHAQNAHAQNEMAQGCFFVVDPTEIEPMLIAREMVEAQKEEGGAAAGWAAHILEERFLEMDRDEQNLRRQEFTAQVQEHFIWMHEERVQQEQQKSEERVEQWRVPGSVIYIGNLAGCVTEKDLGDTFRQIGLVLGAGFAREGCGWVEFQKAEDAVEAVERFDGVVYVKQAMVCGNSESVWAAQAEDYSLLIRHLRKQVW